ncbi:MAG: alpha/beta hydrolase [Alphaproteobacteria bacterium]|jgi:pimeloyl-ACP methyl ester carboxylesterase|nr:alpha/beta hydrolase [Alphaproteobacteria bacterium]MBT4018850.1 alpha/beta hydrolase [Alphaproteobacteria bacterium]MBT4965567.1 alpha/beta hydrolase [Alphaproteobacteria bacterium]MBT6387965.1 alpha/beta hydrolase [Alphaproteobacteria bacterium]
MRIFTWLGSLVALILVIAGGAYFVAQSGLIDLDDAARKKAPGSFATLSDGQVHYQWHGPEGGDITVMVHGLSTPSFVWKGLLKHMTDAGLRVLTYDLYGRGWSDRPDADNNAEFFDRQLVELLKSQKVSGPVNLVGYSMGGAVAVNYTANHPDAVTRLALFAPAGYPDPKGVTTKMIGMMNMPIFGDWFMTIIGRKLMMRGMSAPHNQGPIIPDIVARYKEQISYKGFLRSMVSTMRHFPLTTLQTQYEVVGKQGLPVAAIWGDQDSVVPVWQADLVKNAVPHLQLHVIKGGYHSVPFINTDESGPILATFLTSPAG